MCHILHNRSSKQNLHYTWTYCTYKYAYIYITSAMTVCNSVYSKFLCVCSEQMKSCTVTLPHTSLLLWIIKERNGKSLPGQKCVERWREKEREFDGEQRMLDGEMKGIKETNAERANRMQFLSALRRAVPRSQGTLLCDSCIVIPYSFV